MATAQSTVSETALTVLPPIPHEALAIGRPPEIVLEEASKAAKALIQIVENKKKKVVFNNEIYLEYEDWQTVARFYGMTPIVKSTQYVEFGTDEERARGFEAVAEVLLVSTNQVISAAEAMCLSDEPNWSRKPLFQLRSMAQTRACAKALRNVLAWVVVLAGFKPTPAEEMQQENGGQFVQPPQRKSTPVQSIQNGNGNKTERTVTQPQLNRLFAIATRQNVPKADIERYVTDSYTKTVEKLNFAEYDDVVTWIERQ